MPRRAETSRFVRPEGSPQAASEEKDIDANAQVTLGGVSLWAVFATLSVLVILAVPELGSDPWEFRPGEVRAGGPLAWLVRIADSEWDLGVIRACALLAGLLVAIAATVALRVRTWNRRWAVALVLVVTLLLVVPATLLQVGLRDSTEPWFFTNDSTYQIEIGGSLIRGGDNPYGHDYSSSGLERFYSLDGSVTPSTLAQQVALRHFAYFPGTALSAAAWGVIPAPFDDYRILVALTTIALVFVALLYKAPFGLKLAVGAALAANPLAVRAAWFGVADAPSILFLVLTFALFTRSRYAAAAACLAAAVLLKQFALVAIPFFVAMLFVVRVPAKTLWRAGAAFGVVLIAGLVPFLAADAGALWRDTVAYGASTYRIIGYGLAGILVETGVIDNRTDPYPFGLLALLVWAPLTAWLVWNVLRASSVWLGAAGFTISIFALLFLGRVLQNSYLVWPLAGIAVASLLLARDRSGYGFAQPLDPVPSKAMTKPFREK